MTGECKKCGRCCTYLQVVFPNNRETKRWIEARGLPIVQETERFIELRIPSRCPHLANDGSCDCYDIRPRACREYPNNMIEYWKSQGLDPAVSLGKHCGYRF